MEEKQVHVAELLLASNKQRYALNKHSSSDDSTPHFSSSSSESSTTSTTNTPTTTTTSTHKSHRTSLPLPPGPCARYGHAMARSSDGKSLIMFGGTNLENYFNDVWSMRLIADRQIDPSKPKNLVIWEEVKMRGSTIPQPRFGHAMCDLGDATYLVFGGSNNSRWSDDTFILDAQERMWCTVHPSKSPAARRGHSLTAWGTDYIVLYGGQSHVTYGDVWLFDTRSMEWSEMEVAPLGEKLPEARYCHAAVVHNDCLLVWGGHGVQSCCTPELWSLNLATGQWREVQTRYCVKYDDDGVLLPESYSMPGPRFGLTSTLLDNSTQWILFGGIDKYPWGTNFNEMYALDLDTMQWRRYDVSGALPTPRRLHSAVALNGSSIVMFGGWNGNEFFQDVFIATMSPISLKDAIRRYIVKQSLPYHQLT